MLSAPLLRTAALACALFALGAGSARAATTYEPNLFSDPIIGGNQCGPPIGPAGCSLRGAVGVAKDGDTIKLAAGTYALVFGALNIGETITILGAGPAATTIEQSTVGRVLDADEGLTVSGVTITGGNVAGNAGSAGSTPGQAGGKGGNASGAGIDATGATFLTDVVVTGNEAVGGAGGKGANGNGGTPAGGNGGEGGSASGVGIDGGNPLVLTRVTVSGNTGTAGAGGDGGAAGAGGGTGGTGGRSGSTYAAGVSTGLVDVTITDSTIAGNVSKSAPGGTGGSNGGIGLPGVGGQSEAAHSVGLFSNGLVKLTNVTVAGNLGYGGTGGKGGTATGVAPISGGKGGSTFGAAGGGIGLYNGAEGIFASVTLAANTVTPGTAGKGGSGPSGSGADGSLTGTRGGNLFLTTAEAEMRNSIVAAGSGGAGNQECQLNSGSTLTSNGHNLIGRTGQCIAAAATGDLLGADAKLGPLAANGGPTLTMALLPGSAAIDSGEAPCVDADGQPLGSDQRGLPRGTPCDIGAFEVQPPPPPPPPPGPATASVTQLRVKPKQVRLGKKATISFTLNSAARVRFELRRKVRKNGKLRLLKVGGGPKAFNAAAGPVSRAWRPRGLKPGPYQLRATPVGGTTVVARFQILPKRR